MRLFQIAANVTYPAQLALEEASIDQCDDGKLLAVEEPLEIIQRQHPTVEHVNKVCACVRLSVNLHSYNMN